MGKASYKADSATGPGMTPVRPSSSPGSGSAAPGSEPRTRGDELDCLAACCGNGLLPELQPMCRPLYCTAVPRADLPHTNCYGGSCLICWLVCGLPAEHRQLEFSHGNLYAALTAIEEKDDDALLAVLAATGTDPAAQKLATRKFQQRRTPQFSFWRSLACRARYNPEADELMTNSMCCLFFWPTFRNVFVESTSMGRSLIDVARSIGTADAVGLLSLSGDERCRRAESRLLVLYQETEASLVKTVLQLNGWWQVPDLKAAVLRQNAGAFGKGLDPESVALVVPGWPSTGDWETKRWLWEEQCAGRTATLHLVPASRAQRVKPTAAPRDGSAPSTPRARTSPPPLDLGDAAHDGDGAATGLATPKASFAGTPDGLLVNKSLHNFGRLPKRISTLSGRSDRTNGTEYATPRGSNESFASLATPTGSIPDIFGTPRASSSSLDYFTPMSPMSPTRSSLV